MEERAAALYACRACRPIDVKMSQDDVLHSSDCSLTKYLARYNEGVTNLPFQ